MVSPVDEYFDALHKAVDAAYDVARAAHAKGLDPKNEPETIAATDLAARVEGLTGPLGVAERIRQLQATKAREDLIFDIADDILEGRLPAKANTPEGKIEQVIRTCLAIYTEGVVSSPLEGVAHIAIGENSDHSRHLSIFFAGPIRSAGGTAAVMPLVLGDYCCKKLGISQFKPTEAEIERYVEEISLYEHQVKLQLRPTDDEVRLIASSCPVCIHGLPTEDFEVSAHKHLPRVESDKVRGGACLVIGEGIAMKASQVLSITKKIGLDWSWLEGLIKVAKPGKVEIKPNDKYLEEVIAGRPVFAHPSRPGGFRLRYGRCRNTGIAAKALHPATMILLDGFPAVGTQLKTERPGKGCIVTPCDSIDGPIVKLKSGDVVQVQTAAQAVELKPQVEEILFLGDFLISYGDFLKAKHPLMPAGWCAEWWEQLVRAAGGEPKAESAEEAFRLSEILKVPLHPRWTYFWHDLTAEQLKALAEWLITGRLITEWFKLRGLAMPDAKQKRLIEVLGVPHKVANGLVVIEEHALPLLRCLGLLKDKSLSLEQFNAIWSTDKKPLDMVTQLAGVPIMPKAPTYIGARMGRPKRPRAGR